MLITSIKVRNFGCFGDDIYTLNLAPETFIVGPNNVGKSTFIAAYMILARNGFRLPVTKFKDSDDARYCHNLETEGYASVQGTFHGRTAGWGIALSRGGGISFTAEGMQDDYEEIRQILSNTWYLSSDRVFLPLQSGLLNQQKLIDYNGANVLQFLLEKWTARDANWDVAETWLRKIDPKMTMLKSPLRGNQVSVETTRNYSDAQVDINISYQGGGIQRALQIVSAVVFSPKGSVLIIEEPEMNLHKESQEVLVDLFNTAVNEWDKQVIITTHSWDMILPIISDIGPGSRRGADHVRADPSKFKLNTFSFGERGINIDDYDIANKEMRHIKADFKLMWG